MLFLYIWLLNLFAIMYCGWTDFHQLVGSPQLTASGISLQWSPYISINTLRFSLENTLSPKKMTTLQIPCLSRHEPEYLLVTPQTSKEDKKYCAYRPKNALYENNSRKSQCISRLSRRLLPWAFIKNVTRSLYLLTSLVVPSTTILVTILQPAPLQEWITMGRLTTMNILKIRPRYQATL